MEEYSTDLPARQGVYLMKCDENDYKPDEVLVIKKHGIMCCYCDEIGGGTLEGLHYGLTETSWKLKEPAPDGITYVSFKKPSLFDYEDAKVMFADL